MPAAMPQVKALMKAVLAPPASKVKAEFSWRDTVAKVLTCVCGTITWILTTIDLHHDLESDYGFSELHTVLTMS